MHTHPAPLLQRAEVVRPGSSAMSNEFSYEEELNDMSDESPNLANTTFFPSCSTPTEGTTPNRNRREYRQKQRAHPYYPEWPQQRQQSNFPPSPASFYDRSWYEQTNVQISLLADSQKKITALMEKMNNRLESIENYFTSKSSCHTSSARIPSELSVSDIRKLDTIANVWFCTFCPLENCSDCP